MRRLRISQGGQISLPADVRRRWAVETVLVDDRGNELIVRPAPDDPIAAARGALRHLGVSSEKLRAELREEEADAEARRSYQGE